MQTTAKVIRITDNNIIINKMEFINNCAAISYIGLTAVKYLLASGIGIFVLLAIAAGGDGRTNDGDPKLMCIMFGFSLICAFGMRLSVMLRSMLLHNIRKMNKKHRNMSKNR